MRCHPFHQNIERETGGSTNKKYALILDDFMQKENFYQKIPEVNNFLKVFYEVYMLF
jgi:hypothetical protein